MRTKIDSRSCDFAAVSMHDLQEITAILLSASFDVLAAKHLLAIRKGVLT